MALPHDERGSGPAVLLIHAGIADRSMWDEHLPWLADQGYRAVSLDMPGFGEAPVGVGPQAPWEDVLGALAELELGPAVLVGNSFGAAVALRLAAVAPAAVAGLVLVSPPPLALDPSPELSAIWESEEAALERGDLDGATAAIVEAWVQPDAPDGVRQRVAVMQRRALELQTAAGEVEEAPDPLEQSTDPLRRLSVPVLTAAGYSDMSDFKHGAREIADLVPRGQMATISGAGHLAPLEAPDEFRALLLKYLQTVF